ncbi:replication initiator [Nocardia salmonicida]|uniref:replication initiator n=1 Tax=Nocardia salmonicida TaxID=53431 RepID=UPI0007A43A88|nr:replication initiator [Nocardia salmonicida]
MPSFDAVAIAAAEQHGVCIRPMVLERTDTVTGARELVPVPCGHTLEAVCGPCARQAKRVRTEQCRAGWHLGSEPETSRATASFDQTSLATYRADLMATLDEGVAHESDELRDEIAWADAQLIALGTTGHPPAVQESAGGGGQSDQSGSPKEARGRSTRRREDSPELPRLPVDSRTIGGANADGTARASMFVTITMDSYGKVFREDSTPLDPGTYDYRRAAWDSIWCARLFSRWIQNLRRAVGWAIQYFAVVEPQKRGAPHLHIALRGLVDLDLIRQVTEATYHQVWWPHPTHALYGDTHLPTWDRDQESFVDPVSRVPLQSWNEAMESTWADDAQPAHVARFGKRVHARRLVGGSEKSERGIGYLCKYLTKSVSDILEAKGVRQQRHYAHLHAALKATPCSERCSAWLLYGIVPKGAGSRTRPGQCKGRAHRRETLGLPGNRVLTSERWTGKTIGDHKADRMEFVRRTLAAVGIDKPRPELTRYTWAKITPGTRVPKRGYLLLKAVAQRREWRAEYDRAALAIGLTPPLSPGNSPDSRQISSNNHAIDQPGDGHVC